MLWPHSLLLCLAYSAETAAAKGLGSDTADSLIAIGGIFFLILATAIFIMEWKENQVKLEPTLRTVRELNEEDHNDTIGLDQQENSMEA